MGADMTHHYMPISVSMKNRPCLVIGGGKVALRKVETMLDYGAAITVVAPEVHEKLLYHAERKRIKVERREYRSPEAGAYGLVISASDDGKLNKRVYDDAVKSGTLVNVADDPVHCDFIFPAVLRRDCLTAAISTDGQAPFMSGHLRMVLENIFPPHWERLMKLAASFRRRVRERWGEDSAKKNACYAEFLEADWKSMFESMTDDQIEKELTRMLEAAA
jgi:siroheme synthase-like protein